MHRRVRGKKRRKEEKKKREEKEGKKRKDLVDRRSSPFRDDFIRDSKDLIGGEGSKKQLVIAARNAR